MSKMRFFALQELSNRKPLEVIAPSNKLSDYYGSHVFDRKKMQEYLPKEAYKAVTDAIEKGTPISREIADSGHRRPPGVHAPFGPGNPRPAFHGNYPAFRRSQANRNRRVDSPTILRRLRKLAVRHRAAAGAAA